jgi:hypothetical protein
MSDQHTIADLPFDPKRYSRTARELDEKLLNEANPSWSAVLKEMLTDPELLAMQKLANSVAVRRLRHNDHGPVHMRIAALHCLRIMRRLHEGGIEPSIVQEKAGDHLQAECAVVMGALLHDVGMAITRQNHEWHSAAYADRFMDRYLPSLFPDDIAGQCLVRTLAREVIIGHMGNEKVYSVEAGILLVADGTDMTSGRSRLVGILHKEPAVGDMHKLSADAIEEVRIGAGEAKPVLITVVMSDFVGIFQVEEVLMRKVEFSPIKNFLEICVVVANEPARHYLR